MAQLFTTGPILVFVASGDGQMTPKYLGTCEGGVPIEFRHEWEGVRNDLGGTKLDFDRAYEGSSALITLNLTRWNMPVLQALIGMPNASFRLKTGPQVPPYQAGVNTIGDLGTLYFTELQAVCLWLQFGVKRSAARAGFYAPEEGGMRFPVATLQSSSQPRSGTRARQYNLVYQALRNYLPNQGSLVLYDEDMSAVANVPLD
jgi:hypothetical protein